MLDLKAYDVRKKKKQLQEFLRGKRDLTLDDATEALEVVMLVQALEKEGGKVSAAAKRLGITRARIYRLFGKYGMIK